VTGIVQSAHQHGEPGPASLVSGGDDEPDILLECETATHPSRAATVPQKESGSSSGVDPDRRLAEEVWRSKACRRPDSSDAPFVSTSGAA
jgi:hypothetical protein